MSRPTSTSFRCWRFPRKSSFSTLNAIHRPSDLARARPHDTTLPDSTRDTRTKTSGEDMNLRRLLTLGALALLAGCATADRVKALEEKVASLEEKIDEVAKSGGKAAPRDEKAEKADVEEKEKEQEQVQEQEQKQEQHQQQE